MQDFAASGLFLLSVAGSLHFLLIKEDAAAAVSTMAMLWMIFHVFFKDMTLRIAAGVVAAGIIVLELTKVKDTLIIVVWVIGLACAIFSEIREIKRKRSKEG